MLATSGFCLPLVFPIPLGSYVSHRDFSCLEIALEKPLRPFDSHPDPLVADIHATAHAKGRGQYRKAPRVSHRTASTPQHKTQTRILKKRQVRAATNFLASILAYIHYRHPVTPPVP